MPTRIAPIRKSISTQGGNVTNAAVVEEFCRILQEAPDLTMTAVRLRLSYSDLELVLKKANILKPFESQWDSQKKYEDELYLFPMNVGEKGIAIL